MGSHVRIDVESRTFRMAIRHSGWMGSLLVANASYFFSLSCIVQISAWLTVLDSLCSDFFMLYDTGENMFLCGNFGMLLLDNEHRDKAVPFLRTMVRFTMARGAHSAGVMTYVPQQKKFGLRGVRSRVVNGKRSDLSKTILDRFQLNQKLASYRFGPEKSAAKVFTGHVQFLKSTRPTLHSVHPIQWTPAADHIIWREHNGVWSSELSSVEIFASYEGELEHWTVGGIEYPPEKLLPWIEAATHQRQRESEAKDYCISGILDLVRTQGSWYHSIRYGFLFGPKRSNLDYAMPSKKEVSSTMSTRIHDPV
jgi:hypothetical protein